MVFISVKYVSTKTAVYREININQMPFSLSVSVHISFLFACTLFFFSPSLSYSQNSSGNYLVSTSLYRAVPLRKPLLFLLGSLVRKGKISVDSLPKLKNHSQEERIVNMMEHYNKLESIRHRLR